MDRALRNLGWYLGICLYWAWVYLSFNSAQLVGTFPDGSPVLPMLHTTSGITGCVVFAVAIALHRRIERSPHIHLIEWAGAVLTCAGTLLYTLPAHGTTPELVAAGAIVSGTASPIVALGWGVAFCRPNVREATALTAGSFALAGAMYLAVGLMPPAVACIAVALMPLASVACLGMCHRQAAALPDAVQKPVSSDPLAAELRRLLFSQTGQGKLFLGIFLTMVVCGGLRVYLADLHLAVYESPLLMAIPITAVGLAFLVYSTGVSRTSLNLGTLYRTALPLFAVAIAAIAVANLADARMSFAVVTAGATIIDMITWVLLIEVSRTTRFSALLVFAAGRLVIHAGMATGEVVALQLHESITAFFAVSIVVLLVVASYLFADRGTSFAFEPPTEEELRREPTESNHQSMTLSQGLDEIAARHNLSPRETEVFKLWATGHGSKSVEEKLALSPATVKTHLRHIYENLRDES